MKEGYWSDTIMIIASGNFLLIGRTAGLVHGRRQHCRYRPKAPTPLSFAGRKEGGKTKLGKGVTLACSFLLFSCPNPALAYLRMNIKFLLLIATFHTCGVIKISL